MEQKGGWDQLTRDPHPEASQESSKTGGGGDFGLRVDLVTYEKLLYRLHIPAKFSASSATHGVRMLWFSLREKRVQICRDEGLIMWLLLL